MPRYNPYGNRFQQPEQYDTGEVPYISYQDPDAEKIIAQGMQNMQQRYDLAQTAIGKYLEENAAGKFRDADYENVVNSLNKKLEDIKTNVKDKYQGDYGAAANDVLQQLSKARSTFHQAEKAYEEEQKYKPIYDKLKREGKLVTPKGIGNPFQQKAFDERGNFTGSPDYIQMYERGDYEGWLAENYSKGFQNEIHQTLPNLKDETNPYIIGKTVKGFNDKVIAQKVTDVDAKKFLDDNKVFAIEHNLNPNNPQDRETARKYMVETIQGQVAEQVTYDVTANQLWKRNQEESTKKIKTSPSGVIYEGGLANNPNSFTPQTFFKNSPNARHTVSKQFDEPLKEVTPSIEDYSNGNINLEQYQSFAVETKLRKSDSKLQELWKIGSKKDEDIIKEEFANASKSSDPRVVESAAKGKIDIRNKAAREYSELLEKRASEYIAANGTDLDYQIEFYQPDFSQDKVATAYNNFNTNIEAGYTNPGQFDFLDDTGGMKNKSADKKNKAYDSKKKFAVMGVGGNDATGLIWKVKNPDGTISNAKWNTGYKKQLGAITDIYGSPEMVNVLNSSALDIQGNKIVTTFPDTPKNIEENIRKYKMSAEVNIDDPNLNYIKSGNSYISIDSSSGSPIITTVSSKEKAIPLPKNLIFDILNSLQ